MFQIKELIKHGYISINWGYPHPNIHILAYPAQNIDKQIEWLNTLKPSELIPPIEPLFQSDNFIINYPSEKSFCIYPTKKLLNKKLPKNIYNNRPFTRLLAEGTPQLKPYFFDLSILDTYTNDPRYSFESTGLDGSIYISSSKNLPQKDHVFLQTFGYGIKLQNKVYERCVAVYLCYLSKLPPNQQQFWYTKLIRSKKFFIHPEYDRMTRGEWALKLSIFQAFKEELPIKSFYRIRDV